MPSGASATSRRAARASLIPQMVASSLLVLTTGRQFCERFAQQLPVRILDCPATLPRLLYYQLWHERTHSSSAAQWLREQVRTRPPRCGSPATPDSPFRFPHSQQHRRQNP